METDKGIGKTAQNTCPACSGSWRSEFEKFGEFTLYKCAKCDLVYSSPMSAMTPAGYSEMYGGSGLHGDFATALENGHLEFLKRNKAVSGRNRLLDVGTSTGLFVHAAESAGFKTSGIETDLRAVEAGKKMFPEINLENCDLGEISAQGEKFNYVTLFEVLEHVSEPRRILEEAKKALSPGGKLVVFVPNRNRTPKLYKEMIDRGIDFPPHHLSKWSKKSLMGIFNDIGLSDIRTEDIGKYRFPLLPALGIASRVRNKIVNTEILSENTTVPIIKRTDGLRRIYRNLADARLFLDKILFSWIDIAYRLRGYEKDGLYIEGINHDNS